ncbi:glutathionylspermidine synthase family protein [Candidatus Woesearchaeota archaeon]|jgi:hypothetical protein|nr:glutathionylspermidine synthase family protein [Candidatus Woesearchaeota archaeon]MBT5342378.1 glutathionylspermidine synthase family protein [Candidatus Woesearchaeota archaeon]
MNENLFNEYLKAHDSVLDPLGKRVAKVPLTPFFYNQELIDEVNVIAQSYHRLMEHVTKDYLSFVDLIGHNPQTDSFLKECPDYLTNVVLARLDIFLANNGLKIVEANCESPGGSEESYHLETIFKKCFSNIVGTGQAENRLDNILETLLNSYQEQVKAKGHHDPKEKPNIVLMEWADDITRIKGEFDVFINYARQAGLNCEIVPPQAISFKDGYATLNGKSIDLIYRRIVSDSLLTKMEQGFDFARRLNDSKTAIINPFSSKKASSKKTLVVFSDPQYQHMFPENLVDDLELVRKYIPAARSLSSPENSVILLNELLENQNELVIKASNSYSSVGVYIGADITKDKWKKIAQNALGKDYIVQEKIDLPAKEIEIFDPRTEKFHRKKLIYNVNPYMFDGKFAGFYVRASEDNLTSFKVGLMATVLPCYKL